MFELVWCLSYLSAVGKLLYETCTPQSYNLYMGGNATRYARALESSPDLVAKLIEAGEENLSLQGEVDLSRMLLGEAVTVLGRAHGPTGVLQANSVALVSDLLNQVVGIVDKAAGIEAKKIDQVLDAGKLLVLLAALRDDMRRSLTAAGFAGGVPFIDACFGRAKWTGGLDPETVKEALEAPSVYDVEFRQLERTASDKPVRENDKVISDPATFMAENPVDPRAAEVEKLKSELEEAESEIPRPPSIDPNSN